MILKFSNLAVHLVTNETTSRADSLIFIHDHIKRLSGCCQHSTVLEHSYHAVLHTYQCAVTPPSFHLACLSTSFVTKTSSSLRPRPITGGIQNNNNNLSLQVTPPADREPYARLHSGKLKPM